MVLLAFPKANVNTLMIPKKMYFLYRNMKKLQDHVHHETQKSRPDG